MNQKTTRSWTLHLPGVEVSHHPVKVHLALVTGEFSGRFLSCHNAPIRKALTFHELQEQLIEDVQTHEKARYYKQLKVSLSFCGFRRGRMIEVEELETSRVRGIIRTRRGREKWSYTNFRTGHFVDRNRMRDTKKTRAAIKGAQEYLESHRPFLEALDALQKGDPAPMTAFLEEKGEVVQTRGG